MLSLCSYLLQWLLMYHAHAYVIFNVLYISAYIIQVSGMCGTSRWKAAKVSSKTMKNLDETGLIVSGCRHSIAQKAVNMFRGEMYVC